MWTTLIHQLWTDATLFPPATDNAIMAAAQALSLALPADLIAFLRESDGLQANWADAIFRIDPAAPPHQHLVQHNQMMRTTPDFADLYAPFDDILFIGGDGGGSLFGYQIAHGACTSTILYWNHETDDRTPISTTGLHGYLTYAAHMDDDVTDP